MGSRDRGIFLNWNVALAWEWRTICGDLAELATARDILRNPAGIPIDGVTLALTSGLREDLGVENYSSRRIGDSGRMVTFFGPAIRGLASLALRMAGRRSRRKNVQ